MQKRCKNCGGEYKEHIDYTFTEYMEGDIVEALAEALPHVRCPNYKPMTNLDYLEWKSKEHESL